MDILNHYATNIGALILVLGIIIFVHESGHFITAKAFGIRVFIFSFGFGKRLFGFKWGDTDCRVSAIPLGGYVKLEGEPDDRLSESVLTSAGDARDFTARPRWQRIAVYLAGPAMNVGLTLAAFTGLYTWGWEVDSVLFDRPVIGVVDPGSPAANAGLRTGDEIVEIDGRLAETWETVVLGVHLRPGSDVSMRVRRESQEREITVRPDVSPEKGGVIGAHPLVKIGEVRKDMPAEAVGLRTGDGVLRIADSPIRSFGDIVAAVQGAGEKPLELELYRERNIIRLAVTPRNGKIGIGPSTVLMHFPLGRAFTEAVRETWRQVRQIVRLLGDLLTARASLPAAFQGPVTIAKHSGDAVRAGTKPFLFIVALISISVGILNLFPLPPLDGGHLAVLFVESVVRRDVSLSVKMGMINAGAILLLLLIAVVLYSDVTKYLN